MILIIIIPKVNGFPLPLAALLPLHLQHPPHPQQHGRVTGRTGGPHDGADDGGGVEDVVDGDGVDYSCGMRIISDDEADAAVTDIAMLPMKMLMVSMMMSMMQKIAILMV